MDADKRPTGAHVVALLGTKLGQRYELGAEAPKGPGSETYSGPWDCAELASWAYALIVDRVARGRYFGCNKNDDAYSGFWIDDARQLGTVIPVDEAALIPGAVLLRRKRDGKVGHVAVCVGDGESTIEAHSTKLGVCSRKIAGRVWDLACLVPGVDYTPTAKGDEK